MTIGVEPPFANVTSNPVTIANITSPAVFSAITGLEESLKLNVGLVVIGMSAWLLITYGPRARERCTSGASSKVTDCDVCQPFLSFEGEPDTKCDAAWNYLLFLKMCGLSCFTSTVVSFVLFFPFDFGAILINGGNLFNFFDSPAKNLTMALLLVFTNGCIALCSSHILQILTFQIKLDDKAADKLDRAIWLKYLPSRDPQTGHFFRLKKEDVEQVQQDLIKAIDDCIRERYHSNGDRSRRDLHLDEKELLQGETCIENVEVTVRSGRCYADETKERYKLAGCAFVTLKEEYQVEYLLSHDVPGIPAWSCWRNPSWNRTFRDYRLFSFGRPPFQSVTLRATAAPLPDDIVWENIHMASQQTKTNIIMVVGSVLLFLVMTLLVTPTTFSSVAPPLLDVLSRQVVFLNETISNSSLEHHIKGELSFFLELADPKTGVLQPLVGQLPAYILIFINSILLPVLIWMLSICTTYPLKTSLQEVELNLNFFYLTLNTIAFPLAGVSSIAALAPMLQAWATPYLQEVGIVPSQAHGEQAIKVLRSSFLNGSAGFLLGKYLIGCTFLTSMTGMWDLGQTTRRMINKFRATTEEERKLADTPEEFPCGYWYAWTLSIFVLTLTVGFILPTILPLGCMFFFFRYWVDKYNITTKRYAWGPVDLHGILGSAVVRKIRVSVAFLWSAVGGTLLLEAFMRKIHFIEDHPTFHFVGGIFLLLSVALAPTSWWRFQQHARWRARPKAPRFSDPIGDDTEWGQRMVDFLGKIKILNIKARRKEGRDTEEGKTIPKDINWRGPDDLCLKQPTADKEDRQLEYKSSLHG